MKKLFNTGYNSKGLDTILLLARLMIAWMMLVHGLPKLSMLTSGVEVKFPGVLGMDPMTSLALAAMAEVFCSILLIAGFATRLAVIPLIITMLVAVFGIHAGDFAKQELGLHYLLTYAVLLVAGSGRYSVDYFLGSRMERAKMRRLEPQRVRANRGS